jgi:hypothetical protein
VIILNNDKRVGLVDIGQRGLEGNLVVGRSRKIRTLSLTLSLGLLSVAFV